MNNLIISILLVMSISAMSHAAYDKNDSYEGWRTKDGKIVPDSDNMKSIKGFGGWLIITSDSNWEEKWNTPSYTSPKFNEADDVNYGQKITILTFFINPKLTDSGAANITCGYKVIRPDRTISVDNQDVKCIDNVKIQNPKNVHLSPIVIDYIGEDSDPPGKWEVEININDINRGANISLKSSFTLTSKANK